MRILAFSSDAATDRRTDAEDSSSAQEDSPTLRPDRQETVTDGRKKADIQ